MARPDRYLAAALGEWPDEDLAYAMRADPVKVWRLRLCGYPRSDRWAHDTQQLAILVDADSACSGRCCGRWACVPDPRHSASCDMMDRPGYRAGYDCAPR